MSKRDRIVISSDDLAIQKDFMKDVNDLIIEKFGDKKPLVSIETWGCQMNEHDSEKLFGMLEIMGYKVTEKQEESDIIIFNTCAVRENAELKVHGNLHALKKLKDKNEDLVIAVCGCMMQQKHIVEEIKKTYPHVSLVFGTHNIYKFPEMLFNFLSNNKALYDIWDIDGAIVEGLPVMRQHNTKAFVNIMYGCNNFCTYCIVPYTRGRERSRDKEDIIEEVRGLVASGVKEVTLLGQNVNSYNNHNDGYQFHNLLEDLNEVKGLERIRFMTSHPKDISDELLDAMANLDKVCESLHLPIQSGSTKILSEMNRKYTKEDYLNIIKKAKEKIPNLGITTDIMVGFPGETEEDIDETIDVVNQVQYDLAFTYLYSIRKGTKAETMTNHIPEDIKKARFNRLLVAVNDAANKSSQVYLGQVVEVLVEGVSKKNPESVMGRTRQSKLVNFKGTEELVGKLVKIKITDPKSFSLFGEIV